MTKDCAIILRLKKDGGLLGAYDTSQNNESPNTQNNGNTNPNNDKTTNSKTNDKPSIGLSILSFFIPLVGFILAAANWKSKPISAKRYLIVAGVAFAFCIIVNIVTPDNQSASNSKSLSNSVSNSENISNNEDTFGHDNSVPPTTCSQGEECHISKWQVTSSLGSLRLSNVCWQSKPIKLSSAFDCSVFQGAIEGFQNDIELGDSRRIAARKTSLSRNLLTCAKESNNEKLKEVAKECNGKWY